MMRLKARFKFEHLTAVFVTVFWFPSWVLMCLFQSRRSVRSLRRMLQFSVADSCYAIWFF